MSLRLTDRDAYDQEVREIIQVVKKYEEKYEKHIPVVTAGGIYTHEDVLNQFALGAEGVQVATRFCHYLGMRCITGLQGCLIYKATQRSTVL